MAQRAAALCAEYSSCLSYAWSSEHAYALATTAADVVDETNDTRALVYADLDGPDELQGCTTVVVSDVTCLAPMGWLGG